MKNHVKLFSVKLQLFVIAFFLSVTSTFTYAQIKVKPDGKVGIGITNPDAPFQVHGTLTKFSFPSGMYSPVPLLLDCQYDQTRFYPNTDDKGYLGQYSKFWHAAYSSIGYIDDFSISAEYS